MVRRWSVASFAEGYEQLREDVLTGTVLVSRRWGWNLLLTRGLAAWMDAWPDEDPTSRSETPGIFATPATVAGTRLPKPLGQQMTSILVEMILQRSTAPA